MAKQALTVNDFNLERALNYHLERSNPVGAPEDDVAGIDYKHLKTILSENSSSISPN